MYSTMVSNALINLRDNKANNYNSFPLTNFNWLCTSLISVHSGKHSSEPVCTVSISLRSIVVITMLVLLFLFFCHLILFVLVRSLSNASPKQKRVDPAEGVLLLLFFLLGKTKDLFNPYREHATRNGHRIITTCLTFGSNLIPIQRWGAEGQ
jgi:hypothetical protein